MNAIENEQVCLSCVTAIIQGGGRLANVPNLIKRIILEKMWRERRIRTGEVVKLRSLRELIVEKPLKGWGEDPDKIQKLISDDADALTLWRKEMTPPVGTNQYTDEGHNNIMTQHQGTSRAYTLSRLKIEEPKLFEEVKAGRMSANAAAIKAGFRKKLTVCEQIEKLFKKATPSEQKKITDWILAQ